MGHKACSLASVAAVCHGGGIYLSALFYVRKQLLLSAHLSHRNSVCPYVHHTGGSVKNGAS